MDFATIHSINKLKQLMPILLSRGLESGNLAVGLGRHRTWPACAPSPSQPRRTRLGSRRSPTQFTPPEWPVDVAFALHMCNDRGMLCSCFRNSAA